MLCVGGHFLCTVGHRALSTRFPSADTIARQPCSIPKPVAVRLLAFPSPVVWQSAAAGVFISTHIVTFTPPAAYK